MNAEHTEIKDIKKILLVEDDPRDAELTLAALEEHNLANKVLVVHDGEEALDYLYCRGKFQTRAAGNPVVVLLDLKMPKVSGLEVLKIIKADEHLRLIPIVVLTSSRETPDVIECYKHGVNAYVVKPVDFGDFMKAVKQLGVFWVAVNEPPPNGGKEAPSMQRAEALSPAGVAVATAADEQTPPGTLPAPPPGPQTQAQQRPGKQQENNEIPAPHPAPGR